MEKELYLKPKIHSEDIEIGVYGTYHIFGAIEICVEDPELCVSD